MERIGVRELRQHASRYLAQVASSGEPIEITDRGRPVARLVPVAEDEWENMIVSGEITPPCSDVELRNIAPVAGQFDLTGALGELREHER